MRHAHFCRTLPGSEPTQGMPGKCMTNARRASQISISNRFYSSRPAVGKQICVSVAGVLL